MGDDKLRKLTKVLGTTAIAVVLSIGLFTAGVYAATNGWLSFTSEEQADATEDNISEILSILDRVNDGKLTAEDALKEFEGVDVDGLRDTISDLEGKLSDKHQELLDKQSELVAKQIELEGVHTKLNEKIIELQTSKQYIDHLENELTNANETVLDVHETSEDAVKEAREYVK